MGDLDDCVEIQEPLVDVRLVPPLRNGEQAQQEHFHDQGLGRRHWWPGIDGLRDEEVADEPDGGHEGDERDQ